MIPGRETCGLANPVVRRPPDNFVSPIIMQGHLAEDRHERYPT